MSVVEPREGERYLGAFEVVQVRRRDYDSGKVTEAVVLDANGKRQIATKYGEPLPLTAHPVPSYGQQYTDGTRTVAVRQGADNCPFLDHVPYTGTVYLSWARDLNALGEWLAANGFKLATLPERTTP